MRPPRRSPQGWPLHRRVILRFGAMSPSGPHCAQTRLYISSFVPAAATGAPASRAALGGEADRTHAFATGRSQEMPYRSPVADILFSLNAVADLPALIEQGLMGDLDWDAVSSIVAEAGRFATEEIAPLNRPSDLAGARYENGVVTTPPGFADVYRRWAEAGWNGVSAPAEFGGMGLPHLVNVACTEIWNGASMAFALCPLLTEGAIGALKAHGSRELLGRYLAADGQRPVDRDHEPHRAAGGLGSQRRANPGGTRRGWILSPVRPEDLHHLWRARSRREYRPSRSRPAARRARRDARPFAVPRAEIPGQRRWIARRSATTCAAPASSTSSASTARRPASWSMATTRARRPGWSARRIAASPPCS